MVIAALMVIAIVILLSEPVRQLISVLAMRFSDMVDGLQNLI